MNHGLNFCFVFDTFTALADTVEKLRENGLAKYLCLRDLARSVEKVQLTDAFDNAYGQLIVRVVEKN